MAFRLELSEQAIHDLNSIYDYVEERADAERAELYTRRIRTACLNLLNFPNRGTPHSELCPTLRSVAFERRATIFYEIQDAAVVIVQVLHGGRDVDRAFAIG